MFIGNENNLKKFLSLMEYQTNPWVLVSTKDLEYLKILNHIPKLFYFDINFKKNNDESKTLNNKIT